MTALSLSFFCKAAAPLLPPFLPRSALLNRSAGAAEPETGGEQKVQKMSVAAANSNAGGPRPAKLAVGTAICSRCCPHSGLSTDQSGQLTASSGRTCLMPVGENLWREGSRMPPLINLPSPYCHPAVQAAQPSPPWRPRPGGTWWEGERELAVG